MEGTHENHLRLLTLCKRMGDLCTTDEITELNINIPFPSTVMNSHIVPFGFTLWGFLVLFCRRNVLG